MKNKILLSVTNTAVVKPVKKVNFDYVIKGPQDGAKIASRFIGNDDREVFFVMCLNTKNHVVAVHRCHVGSLNASIVHPREVFKSAILNNTASIIVAHQYPSGDTTPSMEDINVTKRLFEAGEVTWDRGGRLF